MFDWVERYIEQAKPHVQAVGIQSAAYAERAISLLQSINDSVSESDNLRELKKRFPLAIDGSSAIDTFGYVSGRSSQLIQVPADETWELDFISFYVSGGSAQIGIIVNGYPVQWFFANTQLTTGGNGLVLPARSEFKISSNSAFTMIYASVQFTASRNEPRKTGLAGGQYEWQPDSQDLSPDPRQSAQNESRHGRPGVFQGNNVIGDRAGRYTENSIDPTFPKIG